MQLIQISAGQGPEECALAVTLAYRQLCKEAAELQLEVDLLESTDGQNKGTYRSMVLALQSSSAATATGVEQLVERWQGSSMWVCKSPYRPGHKRKNWFFGVEVWQEPQPSDIKTGDFVIKACRASGAGGQHVNKTDSAIQITHLASGIQVRSESQRSQHMNKRVAMALMMHKLTQLAQQDKKWLKGDMHKQHQQLERGQAKRVFTGMKFLEN